MSGGNQRPRFDPALRLCPILCPTLSSKLAYFARKSRDGKAPVTEQGFDRPGSRAECPAPRKGSAQRDSLSRVRSLGPSFREQVPARWCRFWCQLVLILGALGCIVVRGQRSLLVTDVKGSCRFLRCLAHPSTAVQNAQNVDSGSSARKGVEVRILSWAPAFFFLSQDSPRTSLVCPIGRYPRTRRLHH